MKKKWISLSICLVLVAFLVFFVTACDFVSEDQQEVLLFEKKEDDTYAVTGIGDHDGDSIEIPDTYNGQAVTSIGDGAFAGTDLVSVTIPDSITVIGERAFNGCAELRTISLSKSLVIIGDRAFAGTDLISITIPDRVTSIGANSFLACKKLTSLFFGAGSALSSVGEDAFRECKIERMDLPAEIVKLFPKDDLKELNIIGGTVIEERACAAARYLTSVTIASSVKEIGENAFHDCISLTTLTFKDRSILENIDSSAFSGCRIEQATLPANAVVAVPKNVLRSVAINAGAEIEQSSFAGCGKLQSVKIGETVTVIRNAAFSDCVELMEVELPNGIQKIGNSAFYGCVALTSFTVPSNVFSIGEHAFSGCTGLRSVELPSKLDVIGYRAFSDCTELESVDIPNGVTSVGESAFMGCTELYSAYLPKSIGSISGEMFSGCLSLHYVSIEAGIKGIGAEAFSGCAKLTYVTIPNSVTSIGTDAFLGCPIERATIPASVVTALPKAALKNVTIKGDGTSVLAENAFAAYTKLESVVFANVREIGAGAFSGCTSLSSVIIPDSVKSIGRDAFLGCPIETATISPSMVSVIPKAVLKSVTIKSDAPSGMVEENAFAESLELSSVTFENVKVIGAGAFMGCTALSAVKHGSIMRTFGANAFAGCTALTSFEIKDYIETVGERAFYGCTALRSLTINSSQTSIGTDAFLGCPIENAKLPTTAISYLSKDTLKSVELNGGTSIGENAFSGCTLLTSVSIPDTVTAIGENAFSGCVALTSVLIRSYVKSVGSKAFFGCARLTELYCYAYNVAEDAFLGCPIEEADIRASLVSVIPKESLKIVEISGGIALEDNAFAGCSALESVVINFLENIGSGAFENCVNLRSVTIEPDPWGPLESIGSSAFNNTALTSITFEGTLEEWRAVEKGENWAGTSYLRILCSDGNTNSIAG